MATFIDFIYQLERVGLSDVLLPFFLVFTIVFAVLSKTKIMGKRPQARRFDVIIALAMAFAVVIPHILGRYPPGGDIVYIINSSLPQVAVILIAIVMLLLMIGTFGIQWKTSGNAAGSVWVVVSLIIIVTIFGTNAGWFFGGYWPDWLWWLRDPNTQTMLVALLVFGVIIWFVTREPKPAGTGEEKGFKKLFKDLTTTEDIPDDE